MPKEESILKYNHEEKSIKIPFIIYADMVSLFAKIFTCHSNPENASTAKVNKHAASCHLLFMHSSFDVTKNKHDYDRTKDCMKNFCKDSNEHVTKIISYEKKK